MQTGFTTAHQTTADEFYLDQAISLARQGRGWVEPNPMVGCVIVKAGRVIGQGYHQAFGGPHAEAESLAHCNDSPAGATAYVNLEPCCHEGKKTPPCAPRLIAAKVARVVIGCLDPNPAVCGKGVAMLRSAGVDVTVGVREAESRQLNAAFFATQVLHRPYVTLKWAQTAEGFVAGTGGKRLQISGPSAQAATQQLRARCDGILIGVQTAINDDPLLTVRGPEPRRKLLRIILDSTARLPVSSQLARTAREHETHLFAAASNEAAPSVVERAAALTSAGIRVHSIAPDETGRVSLDALLQTLWSELRITHLLVEGGPTVHQGFLASHLADRIWQFQSKRTADDVNAPEAARIKPSWVNSGTMAMGNDALFEWLNPQSPVFFAPSPSTDFLMIAQPIGQ